jgi:hypothetical protein
LNGLSIVGISCLSKLFENGNEVLALENKKSERGKKYEKGLSRKDVLYMFYVNLKSRSINITHNIFDFKSQMLKEKKSAHSFQVVVNKSLLEKKSLLNYVNIKLY